jgi:hypothetical protein
MRPVFIRSSKTAVCRSSRNGSMPFISERQYAVHLGTAVCRSSRNGSMPFISERQYAVHFGTAVCPFIMERILSHYKEYLLIL